MRLSHTEQHAIRKIVAMADPSARVYLFGSRTNDTQRGGDIDLLVESQSIDFSAKLALLADIKAAIGDQKIDLVITKNLAADSNPFVAAIRHEVIEL